MRLDCFHISLTVHFEADTEGNTIAHVKDDEKDEEEILGGKTTEESMNEIVDAQKRQLDQWCFAEHYEPKVLLQVKIPPFVSSPILVPISLQQQG